MKTVIKTGQQSYLFIKDSNDHLLTESAVKLNRCTKTAFASSILGLLDFSDITLMFLAFIALTMPLDVPCEIFLRECGIYAHLRKYYMEFEYFLLVKSY